MAVEFSKGPWVVKGGIVMSADDYVVCTPSSHSTRHEANTRLVCAAPSMYATLAQIERHLQKYAGDDDLYNLAEAAKAALLLANPNH
jgi:hypothetical protein